jgi:hypothetical protein
MSDTCCDLIIHVTHHKGHLTNQKFVSDELEKDKWAGRTNSALLHLPQPQHRQIIGRRHILYEIILEGSSILLQH